MALSDIFQLILRSSFGSEQINNTFFFERSGAAASAAAVAGAWVTAFEPKIANMTCSSITFKTLDVTNLGDLTDFHTEVLADTGIDVRPMLPTSVAVNYSLKLDTRAIRPGSKRFAGVPEEATAINTITEAPYIAFLETLRVQLQTALTSGAGATTWTPVVVKRIKYVPDPLRPTHFAYRLPEPGDTLVVGHVVQALVNLTLSHQVSRANGR